MSKLQNASAIGRRHGVRYDTVLAWARRGWVPCYRTRSGHVLFDPNAVEQALREREARKSREVVLVNPTEVYTLVPARDGGNAFAFMEARNGPEIAVP